MSAIHQQEFDDILAALRANPGPQTVGRIAYYLRPELYESGDNAAWDHHKDNTRAMLKIMRMRDMLQHHRSSWWAKGYEYWL